MTFSPFDIAIINNPPTPEVKTKAELDEEEWQRKHGRLRISGLLAFMMADYIERMSMWRDWAAADYSLIEERVMAHYDDKPMHGFYRCIPRETPDGLDRADYSERVVWGGLWSYARADTELTLAWDPGEEAGGLSGILSDDKLTRAQRRAAKSNKVAPRGIHDRRKWK